MIAAFAARHEARPEGSFDAAASRRLAARAVSLAPGASDPALDRLRPALAYAEAATRRHAAGPWWRGDSRLAVDAWQQVDRAAAEAARTLRRRRRTDLELWPTVERSAAEALARASGYLSLPAAERRWRAASVSRASIDLERARKLVMAGRLSEAIELAERSRLRAEAVHEQWAAAHARFSDPELLRSWRALVDAAVRDAAADGRTHLVVDKLARKLDVYAGARRVAEFDIELGANGLSQKVHAGDRATPEGRYRVTERRDLGRTRYHRALMLDYPTAADRQRWTREQAAGRVPDGAGPGSLIEIHGEGGRGVDWTDGCVALTNGDMDRLYAMVPHGATVTIVGTHERP